MSTGEPIVIKAAVYSFDSEVSRCADLEATYSHLDLGPVDNMDPETFKKEYNNFFGSSPLSSPCPSSPCTTRPPSPKLHSPPPTQELEYDWLYGTSPLSSAPASPTPLQPALPIPPIPSTSQPAVEPSNQAGLNSKAKRNRRRGHANRKRRRREGKTERQNETRPEMTERHAKGAKTTQTSYDAQAIPAASSGFIALPDSQDSSTRAHGLKELLEEHAFRLVKWDGRTVRAIVDEHDRVIAVLAGRPQDSDWDDIQRSTHAALCHARPRCTFPKKARVNRRGKFPSLNAGISFGGGQKVPGNLKHSVRNTKELARLLRHTSFQRIAGFSSGCFASWAPRLHNYYKTHLDTLLTAHPKLRRNFKNSIWAAAAFNFGPQTCTFKHRDFANLPFGWCSITSLGEFDHTKGGHLVLWDLELVVEFPAGSTVLIPSAAVAHSNTPVAQDEARCSFTQFSAGGLFRWTSHGCQLDSKFFSGKSVEDMVAIEEDNRERRKLGLSLFSTFEEICKVNVAKDVNV